MMSKRVQQLDVAVETKTRVRTRKVFAKSSISSVSRRVWCAVILRNTEHGQLSSASVATALVKERQQATVGSGAASQHAAATDQCSC